MKCVGQVLLYGVKALPLTQGCLDRLDGAYAGFVAKMLKLRIRDNEIIGEFIQAEFNSEEIT
eukprot:10059473-Karenia_brevis.AAC.1